MPSPASPPPTTPLPRLGRYELIANIASGGMGAVVLARLAGAGGFQRLFAIKVLHRQYAQNDEFLEMLLDEARIAAQIRHPNVVGIQELAESEQHGYYLVMDYVEGFPLSDVLGHATTMSPRARWRVSIRVLLDALAGLAAAHAATDDRGRPLGVVHRDFSPQNILVGIEGISRVTDFGIAKAAARIAQTRAGQVRGKIAYMSPEQARGESLDARTDVFAAGTVLWECLTAQRLFKGYNDKETYGRILFKPVPSPRDVMPELPVELESVTLSALERDPASRFQSARAMAQALERAAREHDLVGDATEVGEFITRTFSARLEERRRAVHSTAKDTYVSTPRNATGPRAPSPVAGRNEMQREWEDAKDTVVNDPMDEAPTRAMLTENATPELREAIDRFRTGMGQSDPRLAVTAPVPQRELVAAPPPHTYANSGIAPGLLAAAEARLDSDATYAPASTAEPSHAIRWVTLVLVLVALASLSVIAGIELSHWRTARRVSAPTLASPPR